LGLDQQLTYDASKRGSPPATIRPRSRRRSTLAEIGAQVLVANDCGRLMHIAGGAHRCTLPPETTHLAQVLGSR